MHATSPGGGGAWSPALRIGEPILRWTSRARTLEAIDAELKRIWTAPRQDGNGSDAEPHVAVRTSVLNLVVVADRPETAERAASTIATLSGRHPSRTLVLAPADPDGPSWLDAQVQARCVLPRSGAGEACSEFVLATIGGEAGRHLASVVAPLVIHDLPVTVWWPGNPPFSSATTRALLEMADRLIVDGSSFGGSGLDRLVQLARLAENPALQVSDFALLRQSRWREAIASVFDMPEFEPYIGSVERIAIDYAVRGRPSSTEPSGTEPSRIVPGGTVPGRTENIVKPLYHAAWVGSRLGGSAADLLSSTPAGWSGSVRVGRRTIGIELIARESGMPVGTTLQVVIEARRRRRTLRAAVTAALETVHVHVATETLTLERTFRAARRTEADLLAEAVEAGGRDRVAAGTLRLAAALAGHP